MKKIIILFFALVADPGFGQNWQNICSPGTTFYKDLNANLKAFRRDSFGLAGNNDTIFFSYLTIRDSLNMSGICYDTSNGSVLGNKVYKKHDGWFYFFNKYHDTIFINSQASLNSNWKFCKLPNNCRIQATVIAISTDSLPGTTDLVKIIELQAKDNGNNNISNILNQKQIKLSQHYGLTKMLDVIYIPADTMMYFFAGKSTPQTGLLDITWLDIYGFNVGDIFHYEWYYQSTNGDASRSTIKKVLNKTVLGNNDTLIYTIEECYKLYSQNGTGEFHDTIVETYVNGTFYPLNTLTMCLPEEFHPGNFIGQLNWSNLYFANVASYNQRLTKGVRFNYFKYYPGCWEYGIFENYEEYRYTNGLGLTYSWEWEVGGGGGLWTDQTEELIYFKKGNETWGIPLSADCNTFVGIENDSKTIIPGVHISPNPVETRAEIIIEGFQTNDIFHYILHNYSGNSVRSGTMNSSPFTFNRGELLAGLYLLSVFDKKDNLRGRMKIIIQ